MHGRFVAIVDDDTAVRNSLKFLMETSGYEVMAYTSGTAFLADRTEQPACLIVDYNMPGMTGLEVVERLRRDGSAVPVLLMTGFAPPSLLERAEELGVETVLEKPLEMEPLLKFVSAHR
jgi:two-component system response regulator FixJ